MMEPRFSYHANKAIQAAIEEASKERLSFVTPELLLYMICNQPQFRDVLYHFEVDPDSLQLLLRHEFDSDDIKVDDNLEYAGPQLSYQMEQWLGMAMENLEASSAKEIDVPHLIASLVDLPDSYAAYYLLDSINEDTGEFLESLLSFYNREDAGHAGSESSDHTFSSPDGYGEDDSYRKPVGRESEDKGWREMVECINETYSQHNPLIGREEELERTIRVLCRKEKNNPLHVGHPGVGKTAMVYGLAALIEEGKVPERLRASRIYRLDVGHLLAGTKYRGDFEKRIKKIMDGLGSEQAPVVYIDEIHTLVGAGAVGEGSMDASNMLKPYLEAGKIRFIGSTTYEEYNRYFAKSKSLVRRFQQIDIDEPGIEEAIKIADGLKGVYEEFHGVVYAGDVVEYAVRQSARYLTGRYLPDKALDLLDEAGAYRETHPLEGERQTVDRNLISEVLAKMCKVEALAEKEDDPYIGLRNLEENISARIYGQPDAVKIVSEAVMMAKAGLTDETKPLASLLFVGPTGVGKTEVAKVLAKELDVELLRFDMSEYAEKHTVAKLIGAPAGYVGYEDGGILTDAVRRSPNAVLLLDEIEKAHPDIFNVLLQVMDYGKLSDNKGEKADFRNIILIMTSNAGAQFAKRANLGFGSNVSSGDAMLGDVKKLFKPEFINRLSATVVFNDMDREMASRILRKKLSELDEMLKRKRVSISFSDASLDYLLDKGFTKEYGAREFDRVINSTLKPLLMRAILFGELRDGGEARIDVAEGSLILLPGE